MNAVRKIKGWNGAAIMVYDRVTTLSGLVRRIEAIDSDGYARLEGEVSVRYVGHLTKLIEHDTYTADLTDAPPPPRPPITAAVMPVFLSALSARARNVPPTGD